MIPGTGGPQILGEIEVMRKETKVLRQRRLQRAREELRSATASPLRTAPADELRQQMQELSAALESAGDLQLEILEHPLQGASGALLAGLLNRSAISKRSMTSTVKSFVRDLRLLWKADGLIAEIWLAAEVRRSGILLFAGLVAMFGLGMENLAAYDGCGYRQGLLPRPVSCRWPTLSWLAFWPQLRAASSRAPRSL